MKAMGAIVAIVLFLTPRLGLADEPLEESVCGLKEPMFFFAWRTAAGSEDPERLSQVPNREAVAFVTKDRRTLHGYKIPRTTNSPSTRGYLLVIQGNAMLVGNVLRTFRWFADAGLDVYMFDYRGYGMSEGDSRIKAIVSDYVEITSKLGNSYAQKLIYGLSLGGIVAIDAINRGAPYDRLVVDSVPSDLQEEGCPSEYFPVNNVPADASRIMVIRGTHDQVVKPERSFALGQMIAARHGIHENRSGWNHPFQDRDPAVFRARLRLIEAFLLPN